MKKPVIPDALGPEKGLRDSGDDYNEDLMIGIKLEKEAWFESVLLAVQVLLFQFIVYFKTQFNKILKHLLNAKTHFPSKSVLSWHVNDILLVAYLVTIKQQKLVHILSISLSNACQNPQLYTRVNHKINKLKFLVFTVILYPLFANKNVTVM